MAGTKRARAVWRSLVTHRFAWMAGVDALLWGLAILSGLALRYEFDVPASAWGPALAVLPVLATAQLVAGCTTGVYVGRYQLGSFEEVWGLVRTCGFTAGTLLLVDLIWNVVPLSLVVFAPIATLVGAAAIRYAWRLTHDNRRRPGDDAVATIVVGAGSAGTQAIRALLDSPDSPYLPVALLDDDPRKGNLVIKGVPVLGAVSAMGRVAAETGATALILAIPSADSALVRDIAKRAVDNHLKVRILPPVAELIGGTVGVSDIRPITPEDLLGRRAIDTDVDSIAGYLTGRRVLITGAGGSIGSELARQVHRFAPEQLVLLDRDESALHAVQLSIDGRGLLDTDDLVVADIRDRDRIEEVFERVRPEVVFHAAALKHLPLLQRAPGEALKTNIWGTQTLLQVAADNGVERFVNISTDKAADPSSVLGWSKRVTERLTAHAAASLSGAVRAPWLSVRFGNVLGSRGSVLTAFAAQIAAGGPVTVTHPEVTRYFMTIEEAVQLVIQAGAIGSGGDVLVLDMGVPVRIDDVARQLVEDSDRPIEIVYTGLRQGEKLHEVLLGTDEDPVAGPHPLITHVTAVPLAPAVVAGLDPRALDADALPVGEGSAVS
jgi:FlaA1/EpsC-like NDP-sugar epimerase